MKFLFRSIYFFIVFFGFSPLLSLAQSDYSKDGFPECFNQKEVDFLKNSIALFDDFLIDEIGEANYKTFLQEVIAQRMTESKMLKSDLLKFWVKNKSDEFFKRIWSERKGFYYFNTSGKYFFCLKRTANLSPLSSTMATMRGNPDLNPKIIHSALYGALSTEDYQNINMKLFIMNHVFGEYALNPKG